MTAENDMQLRNRIAQLERLRDTQAAAIERSIDTHTKLLGYIDKLEERLAKGMEQHSNLMVSNAELLAALRAAQKTTAAVEQFYVIGEVRDRRASGKLNHYEHSFVADQGLKRFKRGAKIYVKLSDEERD